MLNTNYNSMALIYGLLFTNNIDSQQYNNLLIGIITLDVINGDITGIVKKDINDNKIINHIIDKNAHSDIEIIINNINIVLSYIKSFDIFNAEKSILNGEIELETLKNIDKQKLIEAYIDRTDYDDKELDLDVFINKISDNIYQKLSRSLTINYAINNICDKLYKYEINTKMLIYNQLYILYNNAKSYIQFYSLFGSYYINNYLRNKNSVKDIELENHINNIFQLMKHSPNIDSNYEVYRFIDNDDYIEIHGDIEKYA